MFLSLPDRHKLFIAEITAPPTSTPATKKKVAPKNFIRTSAADRTLDSMFPVVASNSRTQSQPQPQPQTQPRRQAAAEENGDRGNEEPQPPLGREGGRRTKEIPESPTELTSIKDLRKRILVREHSGIFTGLGFRSMSLF